MVLSTCTYVHKPTAYSIYADISTNADSHTTKRVSNPAALRIYAHSWVRNEYSYVTTNAERRNSACGERVFIIQAPLELLMIDRSGDGRK